MANDLKITRAFTSVVKLANVDTKKDTKILKQQTNKIGYQVGEDCHVYVKVCKMH